jgi:hypothetical protein
MVLLQAAFGSAFPSQQLSMLIQRHQCYELAGSLVHISFVVWGIASGTTKSNGWHRSISDSR